MGTYVLMGGCHIVMRQVLLSLRSAGKNRCIILGGPDTRFFKRSPLCDQHIEISYARQDDVFMVRHINELARKNPDAMLVPVDCESVRMIERVKNFIQMKTIAIPNVATMNMFDDKWKFYLFCKEYGLSVPDTLYVGGKSDLQFQEVAKTLGTPFILKPANKAGSEGVSIVHTEAHYRSAIINNSNYQFDALVAQRYIQGVDVCIDLYAVNGSIRALAFQRREGGAIRFFQNDQMEQIAHRLSGVSGYNGIMNLDARIEEGSGRVYLLESNPRFWASLTASAGAGLNFVAESIKPLDMEEPVKMLTHGVFYLRHPLIRPAAWGTMLFDQTNNGRLLRAKMKDWHNIGEVLQSVASSPFRQMPKMFKKKMPAATYQIQQR